MKFRTCFYCNNFKYTPYDVTDVGESGSYICYNLCLACGNKVIQSSFEPKKDDLKKYSDEELLDLLDSLVHDDLEVFMKFLDQPEDACECGMTEKEFEKKGRFGCAKCYTFFGDLVEHLVNKYHGADTHIGKRPATKDPEDYHEKKQFLKLKLTRAIEFEEYEKAAELKKQLDELA